MTSCEMTGSVLSELSYVLKQGKLIGGLYESINRPQACETNAIRVAMSFIVERSEGMGTQHF